MVTNFQKIKKLRLWYLLLPPGKKIYFFVSPKQNILTDLYISSFTSSFLELTVMEFREILCFKRKPMFLGFSLFICSFCSFGFSFFSLFIWVFIFRFGFFFKLFL